MSPRRPGHDDDLSFEQAAEAAGLSKDLGTVFDGAPEIKVNEEKKPLLGRRIVITIERSADFDALMAPTVRKSLLTYLYALEIDHAGKGEFEAWNVDETTRMNVLHETYALDVVEPKL